MNILESLAGIFKRRPMTRERLEKHKEECRKRKEETQLKLAREKTSGNPNNGRIMKYEREIAYWTRLLERLDEAEIVE